MAAAAEEEEEGVMYMAITRMAIVASTEDQGFDGGAAPNEHMTLDCGVPMEHISNHNCSRLALKTIWGRHTPGGGEGIGRGLGDPQTMGTT